MKNINRILILFLAFIYVSLATECKPNKQFYQDHERGWFYKEYCEEEKIRKEKLTKKKAKKKKNEYAFLTEKTLNIPFDKLDQMDPDEIDKLYIKARKIAVMYPTQHNIKQYQKLVIWIMRKGFAFTENWMRAVRTDTELARYASEVPTSTVERGTYFLQKVSYRDQVLQQFKDRAGLVIVVKKGCPYCERQKIILRWFKNETGWEYKLVDITRVPNMVRKFGIARVPDIFLVVKGNNGQPLWIRVGTGLHTKDELKDIILFGLYNLGLIKPEDKSYVLY